MMRYLIFLPFLLFACPQAVADSKSECDPNKANTCGSSAYCEPITTSMKDGKCDTKGVCKKAILPPKDFVLELPFPADESMYCAKGTREPGGTHSSCLQLDRFAIDFAADAYTPPKLIVAPEAGVVKAIRNCKQHSMFGAVEDSQCGGGWGNLIWIDHENGFTSQITHVSAVLVNDGTKVLKGQPIGFEGNSGSAGNKHMHYSLRKGSIADMKKGAPSVFWTFRTATGLINPDSVTCLNWIKDFETDEKAKLTSVNKPTQTTLGKWHY